MSKLSKPERTGLSEKSNGFQLSGILSVGRSLILWNISEAVVWLLGLLAAVPGMPCEERRTLEGSGFATAGLDELQDYIQIYHSALLHYHQFFCVLVVLIALQHSKSFGNFPNFFSFSL